MFRNGFRVPATVVLISLAMLAMGAIASSATAAPLKVLGFEDDSCASWVQSKDEPERRQEFVSWARGFLSGHNYANQRQQVSEVSNATVERYIEQFCRQKPQSPFTEAVYRMSDQYSGRNAPITK